MSETGTTHEPQLSADGFAEAARQGMIALRKVVLPEDKYDLITATVQVEALDRKLAEARVRIIGTEATAEGVSLALARIATDDSFGRKFIVELSPKVTFVQQDLSGAQLGVFDMRPDGTGNVHGIFRNAFEIKGLYPEATIDPDFTIQSIDETLAAAQDFMRICLVLAATDEQSAGL